MPQILLRSLMSAVLLTGLISPALGLAAPSRVQDSLSSEKAVHWDFNRKRSVPAADRADEVDPRELKDFEASERTTLMDSDLSYEDRQSFREDTGVQ